MSDLDRHLAAIAGEDEWTRHRALEELASRGLPASEIRDLERCLADDNATLRAAARMALTALAAPGSASRLAAQTELRTALSSDVEDVRVLAASALGEAGDPEAGPALIGALADPSPNVVAAAADALGELSFAPALDALVELSATGDLWLRAAAVVALGRLGDERAVPALGRLAGERGLEKPIAEAVGEIRHPSTLEVLRRTRNGAPDASLRTAGRVLAAFPDVEPPDWVVAGARDREGALREALGRNDDPAVARLVGLSGSPESVRYLLDLAGPPRWSEAAIIGLLAVPSEARAKGILGRLEGADERELAILLALLPPLTERSRIRELVPLLDHGSEDVRSAAAGALARSPAPEAFPLLAEVMERETVAPEVIRAMGELGASACASLLPLLGDPSPAARCAAASALARCASAEIEHELRGALAGEDDPDVRDALLRPLALSAGSAALDILEDALHSDRLDTRLAAIDGLGATKAEAAVGLLGRCLEGTSPSERLAALGALGELDVPSAAPLLQPHLRAPDLDVRRAAARAALSLADSLDDAVVEALVEDGDGWIRSCGARILGRRGTGDGRRRLEGMADTDPDPAVRSVARRVLAEGG